jgi:tRNA-splicing ligase RtcB
MGGVPMLIINTSALPIYTWAPDLEEGALRQASNCADLPVAFHHVAVMADGHQGYGVPIGAVLPLSQALSPYAVGNDIGCGMGLLPTKLSREDLMAPVKTKSGGSGPAARDEIMGWVQSTVPAGAGSSSAAPLPNGIERLLHSAFDAMEEAAEATGVDLSTTQSFKPGAGKPLTREEFLARGRAHAGTLGAGNHFIELLADPDGQVSVLIHSGSRGVGALICSNFHRMALTFASTTGHPLPDPGLAWLPLSSTGPEDDPWGRAGRCYQVALRAGLDYAKGNRQMMLETVGEIIERRFHDVLEWDRLINIHHNDAA